MKNTKKNKVLVYSIVIPVYNSESSLEELSYRINEVFTNLNESYEVIFVDDSSSDNSWKILKMLRERYKKTKIIKLMKNFGQHNALICGFQYVTGRYIITMDDDLQNPPEEIPKLINEIKKGYDSVIGVQEIKQDTLFKKIGSSFINYINAKVFNKPKDIKLSSFRIMTKAVTDEIKILKTPYPYISGMLLSLTSNIGNVTVKHDKRKYGRSQYNLSKLIKLAFNLIINYTSLPLQLLTSVGITVSFIAFCIGLYFIIKKLLIGIAVPGWTSIAVLLSFFNGLLLIILSVIGEYLGRIIVEISKTKQFVIREKYL